MISIFKPTHNKNKTGDKINPCNLVFSREKENTLQIVKFKPPPEVQELLTLL